MSIDNILRDAVLTLREYVGWVPLVLAASFVLSFLYMGLRSACRIMADYVDHIDC